MQQAVLAFLEGTGLILSPCILPILPLVLAASLTGGKRRPIGIIIGFIASFALFALLSRQLVKQLALDTEILRHAAIAMLALLGIVMLVPRLEAALGNRFKGLASLGDRAAARLGQGEGLRGGVVVGSLIGLIWTPCAGPIMAAAVVQIIQARTDAEAALTVLAFAAGAALPMLLIALAGRQFTSQLGFLKAHAARLRQGLGLIILATAVALYSGWADRLLAGAAAPETAAPLERGLQQALPQPYPAPQFAGLQNWLNSSPLRLSDLHGKVVLVDFWTYSCINCVRTLPYVRAWYEKYRDQGFVVVGIHAPEFEFEKKIENVRNAITAHGIRYPVAQDNDLATWSAFRNQYWPAHYLIDRQGRVVYTHFGEGHYGVTEHNIRTLLGIEGLDAAPPAQAGRPGADQSPETYLGYARGERFASPEDVADDAAAFYSFPATLSLHGWALQGPWRITPQYSETQAANAALRYHFRAGRVFLVLGSADGRPLTVRVRLNDAPPGLAAGKDAPHGQLTVTGDTLYELIRQDLPEDGIVELTASRPGLRVYAFTFGE